MLGAAWSALNGDDTAPNPFGLALQQSFPAFLVEWMRTCSARPVLTQALASTVPPQANLRCPLHVSPAAAALAAQLEPLYPTGRNLFYAEGNNSLSYAPYRVLPSLPAFNRSGIARRILVDVGAGPFHTSPKHLLDTYAAIDFPFTDAFLMEQSTDTGTVPSSYAQRTKIRQIKKFVRVGTQIQRPMWLPGYQQWQLRRILSRSSLTVCVGLIKLRLRIPYHSPALPIPLQPHPAPALRVQLTSKAWDPLSSGAFWPTFTIRKHLRCR